MLPSSSTPIYAICRLAYSLCYLTLDLTSNLECRSIRQRWPIRYFTVSGDTRKRQWSKANAVTKQIAFVTLVQPPPIKDHQAGTTNANFDCPACSGIDRRGVHDYNTFTGVRSDIRPATLEAAVQSDIAFGLQSSFPPDRLLI